MYFGGPNDDLLTPSFLPTNDALLKPKIATPRFDLHVKRMQEALNDLAQRVRDPAVGTSADGIVGPNTLKAVNRAVPRYATFAPPEFRTGKLVASKVKAYAAQITTYLNKAGSATSSPVAMASVNRTAASYRSPSPALATLTPTPSAPYAPTSSPGGLPMNPPYYPPSPYPSSGYPAYAPPRAGGLPTDRATLDVKAFIPAQYQHVRLSPVGGLLIVGGALAVIMLIMQNRKLARKP
jgi:hypothetical protein